MGKLGHTSRWGLARDCSERSPQPKLALPHICCLGPCISGQASCHEIFDSSGALKEFGYRSGERSVAFER